MYLQTLSISFVNNGLRLIFILYKLPRRLAATPLQNLKGIFEPVLMTSSWDEKVNFLPNKTIFLALNRNYIAIYQSIWRNPKSPSNFEGVSAAG